ncbi:MAG: 1-deoxy-D-xylulose-5-phosphate reductoisomerase [Acidimicrobiia bacterium]|nr:1-deoxy-D-xylulose-5-phosphate reductoisomerase [Acidimicrobiia bacterium]
MSRTVALVGSTGSIGTQAVDVISADPDRFRVIALGAATSIDVLGAQAHRLRPEAVAIADVDLVPKLEELVPPGTEVVGGSEALADVSRDAEVVLNAVVGFAGLPVTMAALEAGRRLALANKQSLIAAGPVVQQARATPGAEIVPVDSEHSAIHQCLRAGRLAEVRRIVLTASGGPFRGRRAEDLADVTVDEALAHPTWNMGPQNTIDSSTLMNKGLEVIEAHELFGVDYDNVDVVVHPQSIVHSMVEFADGATVAQLSNPDMRLPIGYALAYPDRGGVAFGALDWTEARRLDFEAPDRHVFACLELAYQAGRTGGTAPTWLNAANEVAVGAFLEGVIAWREIAETIREVLEEHDGTTPNSVDVVIDADRRARAWARRAVQKRAR